MTWTPEQVKALHELIDQGLSSNQIAKELDVTRSSVVGRASRDGKKLGLGRIRGARAPRYQRHVPFPECRHIRLHLDPEPDAIGENVTTEFEAGRCSIMQLRDGVCRWPMWDMATPKNAKFYCGAPTHGKSSYCQEHMLLGLDPNYVIRSNRVPNWSLRQSMTPVKG